MALVKWNPSKELFKIERDFNRLFKNFSDKFGITKRYDDNYDTANWAPLADILEKEDKYLIAIDLPGLTKKDVTVAYNNGLLSIKGEKKEEKEIKNASFYSVESSYGKFYRCFNLPEGIDEQKINAELIDGTLKVTVPKAEKNFPKQISISIN